MPIKSLQFFKSTWVKTVQIKQLKCPHGFHAPTLLAETAINVFDHSDVICMKEYL